MLEDLQELIFSLKEKLSDNDYLKLMNELKKVNQKIQDLNRKQEESEDEEESEEEEESGERNNSSSTTRMINLLNYVAQCRCRNGDQFCYRSLSTFLNCRVRDEFLQRFPLTRWALIKAGIINDDSFVLSVTPLCFEKKMDEYNRENVVKSLKLLIEIQDKMNNRETRSYNAIQTYNFLYQNYLFLERNPHLKENCQQKLVELEQCFEPIPFFDENPFSKWKDLS